jgi:hypothetical protein
MRKTSRPGQGGEILGCAGFFQDIAVFPAFGSGFTDRPDQQGDLISIILYDIYRENLSYLWHNTLRSKRQWRRKRQLRSK